MDARLCGEVRAADKRGARGVGGDGSPAKKRWSYVAMRGSAEPQAV